MYYCNDCKETFSMPEYLVDIKHFQCTKVCPHCRSENFDEAPDFLDKIKDELTIDDMINYSQKSKVEISDFILKVLGEKQINNILNNAIKETLSTISLIEMKDKYFENNYEVMADFAIKYNKNKEN